MTAPAARSCAVAIAALAAASLTSCAPSDLWGPFDTDTVFADITRLERPDRSTPALPQPETPRPFLPDGPLDITVEQAALYALENNRSLRVERFTPQIIATFEDIERGVFDPEVFAGAEYFEQEGVEVSRATGENFTTRRDDSNLAAGVRQRLPTGTDLELGLTVDRTASDRAPEQQTARLGLSLTQSLLRGFGPAVNLARIRQAELETAASRYELRGFIESLLAQTETAYWLHTLAQQRIRIFEESLEIARLQQQEVEDRIEIGVLPSTERASAEAEVAQREQALIDARSQLETLRLRLLRLMNPGPGDPLVRAVTTVSDPRTQTSAVDDIDDRITLALRSRPELAESRLRLDQARLETIVTRNGLLPRLDFFLALGKSGYADSFTDAFRDLDEDSYDLAAGLVFSTPIGNRAARARQRGALASRAQAVEAIANLEQLVAFDVRIAAAEVDRARRQITASAATRMLREEALRAENERFRVGRSTSILIAQAQRDLLESQIAEVDALVAYRVSVIALHLAEGTLIERRGLAVPAE